jgi:hypothetical protein
VLEHLDLLVGELLWPTAVPASTSCCLVRLGLWTLT